jgi:hypothetical protein
LPGRYEEHFFDLAVANGKPIVATLGVSFQVMDPVNLERNINWAKWTLGDVRQNDTDVQLAVITLPPAGRSKSYAELVSTLLKLHVDIVREEDVPRWAREVSERVKEDGL